MSDEDTADPSLRDEDDKPSKRDRFKDAFARTKTKIHKHRDRKEKQELELPDDVNDFLAAGRPSSSSSRPSAEHTQFSQPNTSNGPAPEDTLIYPAHTTPPTRPAPEDRLPYDTINPPNSETFYPKPPQASPRRIQVPRIDVSGLQRFPNARPVETSARPVVEEEPRSRSDEHLRPEFRARSQSAFSSAGRKQRIRGLSVGFSETPPVIIGEGGDEAETPPVEISRAKARARSLSPTSNRRPPNAYVRDLSPIKQTPVSGNRSPRELWLPQPFKGAPTGGSQSNGPAPQPHMIPTAKVAPINNHDDFVPKPMKRTQTGMSALDREFDMSLGIGTPVSASTPNDSAGSQKAPLLSPKPMRPPPSYTVIEQGKPAALEQKVPSVGQPPTPKQTHAEALEMFKRRKPPSPPPVRPHEMSEDTPEHSPPSTQSQQFAEPIRYERTPPMTQHRLSPEQISPPNQMRHPAEPPQYETTPPTAQPRYPPEQVSRSNQILPPSESSNYDRSRPVTQPRHLPEDMRRERVPPPPDHPPPRVRRKPSPAEHTYTTNSVQEQQQPAAPREQQPHTLRRKNFVPQLRQPEESAPPPPTVQSALSTPGSAGSRRFYETVNPAKDPTPVNPNNNPPEGWI